MKVRNQHGRVGVKRLTPTCNQTLRQRVRELERINEKVVAQARAAQTAAQSYERGALVTIHEMTAKSKTGTARKVHSFVDGVLA
jgi:hypothetical protein